MKEKTIYEGDDIRIFTEEPCPSNEEHHETHKCACGRSVCCGKHKGCAKAMSANRVRIRKSRTY